MSCVPNSDEYWFISQENKNCGRNTSFTCDSLIGTWKTRHLKPIWSWVKSRVSSSHTSRDCFFCWFVCSFFVNLYLCIHIYIHEIRRTYVHIPYVYSYAYIYNVFIHVYVCIYVYMYICIHVHKYILYVYMNILVCIQIYTNTAEHIVVQMETWIHEDMVRWVDTSIYIHVHSRCST